MTKTTNGSAQAIGTSLKNTMDHKIPYSTISETKWRIKSIDVVSINPSCVQVSNPTTSKMDGSRRMTPTSIESGRTTSSMGYGVKLNHAGHVTA